MVKLFFWPGYDILILFPSLSWFTCLSWFYRVLIITCFKYLHSKFNQDHVGKRGFCVRLLSDASHMKIKGLFQASGREML